ncbi:MAG: hypothetical protein IH845_00745 [Nanoarchaeota archaeon]|nr:hypothetical protein [Nanoarchaeota archaeon]
MTLNITTAIMIAVVAIATTGCISQNSYIDDWHDFAYEGGKSYLEREIEARGLKSTATWADVNDYDIEIWRQDQIKLLGLHPATTAEEILLFIVSQEELINLLEIPVRNMPSYKEILQNEK